MDWSFKTIKQPWNGYNQILTMLFTVLSIVVIVGWLVLGVAITWIVSIMLSWAVVIMAVYLWLGMAR